MATSVSGVYRVVVIPFSGYEFRDDRLMDNLPTLVGSVSNLLVSAVGVSFATFRTFSGGAFHHGGGIKIELWETTAGDAAIVSNLAAFQTAMGRTIYTWSESITWTTP